MGGIEGSIANICEKNVWHTEKVGCGHVRKRSECWDREVKSLVKEGYMVIPVEKEYE